MLSSSNSSATTLDQALYTFDLDHSRGLLLLLRLNSFFILLPRRSKPSKFFEGPACSSPFLTLTSQALPLCSYLTGLCSVPFNTTFPVPQNMLLQLAGMLNLLFSSLANSCPPPRASSVTSSKCPPSRLSLLCGTYQSCTFT